MTKPECILKIIEISAWYSEVEAYGHCTIENFLAVIFPTLIATSQTEILSVKLAIPDMSLFLDFNKEYKLILNK